MQVFTTSNSGSVSQEPATIVERSDTVGLFYDPATQTYRVRNSPIGQTFELPDERPSSGQFRNFSRVNGPGSLDEFSVLANVAGTMPDGPFMKLTYLSFARWQHVEPAAAPETRTTWLLVGYPTEGRDLPRTGNASYSGAIIGDIASSDTGFSRESLNGSVKLTTNFGTGEVRTSFDLRTQSNTLVGNFSGSGTITPSTSDFKAPITSSDASYLSGSLSGSFFGPQAAEFGYAFALSGTQPGGAVVRITGIAAGPKN